MSERAYVLMAGYVAVQMFALSFLAICLAWFTDTLLGGRVSFCFLFIVASFVLLGIFCLPVAVVGSFVWPVPFGKLYFVCAGSAATYACIAMTAGLIGDEAHE